MKKLLALLLLLPVLAFAQSYPNPTYSTVTVTPPVSTLTKAFTTLQTLSGSTSTNCTTNSPLVYITYPCANSFFIPSDGVAASSAQNSFDEWQFSADFGGSTLTSSRQILDVIGNFTGASNSANNNKGYVALVGQMLTNSPDGGTAPTLANGAGSFFGINSVVIANSGAQNLFGLTGEEVDIICQGCSTAIRLGVSAVNQGTTQASVLADDAAFHVGAITPGSTASWHQALNLSHLNGGAPLDTTGCVICTDATNDTIATGVDLSAYTISGNFLKGPGGYSVSGAGVTTGATVTQGSANNSTSFSSTAFVYNLLASGLSPGAFTNVSGSGGAFVTLNASGNDALMYSNSSAQSIPNNALTTVTNWTKVTDRVNANFNAATGVFTAPATGIYQISGQLTYSSAIGAVNTQYTAAIDVNGSIVAQGAFFQESTSTDLVSVPFSGVVSLTSGQTLQIQAFQTSGVARTLSSTAALTFMSINRLP
jgi:hypothetical protein